MVSGIPPTSSDYSSYQSSESNNNQALIQQMEEYEQELRQDIGPPPQTEKLEALLNKMQSFMTNNQQALFKMMEKNGFPVHGAFSITNEFETAMDCIKGYLQNPNPKNEGGLDLLNESITQINFYLTHKFPS